MSLDLVTGATGLLGANLVRGLAARGRRVRVLVRGPASRTAHLDDLAGVERAPGDLAEPEALARAADGCELVYHCAALVSMDARQAEAMRRANVEGTANVVAACRRAGVRRLVHASSVDAIGLPDGPAPSAEDAPWNWDRHGVDNPYARTKLESQRLVLAACAEGLDAVVVNPAYMLGAWDLKPSSGRMILEVASGKAVGYTPGGNNFVHVEDVVAGMLAAAERGRRGELYILGNANLSYREVFTEIAAVVGARPPWLAIPWPAARLAGWGGDLVQALTGREQAVNSLTVRLGWVRHYYDPAKAVRELGLPQTPVRAAIERAVAWFRDTGRLPPARAA